MTNADSTTHAGQELGLADVVALLGHRQWTSIMQKQVGAPGVINHHVTPGIVPALAAGLVGSDVWYGVNEIAEPPHDNRRATEKTVGRWCAVWADLDFGDGKSGDNDTINAIIDDLTDAYGTEPVFMTLSGHGVQPVWILDHQDPATVLDTDEKRATAVAMLKRHGRLVQASAAAHGVKADSVFDLPRVLRAPGTTNHKDPADPVPTSAIRGTGVPLTVAELDAALTRAGVAPMDSDRPTTGEVVSAPSTWSYRQSGQQACKYADDMVRGWAGDQPHARHPWLVAQAVRIAAARRHGCFTGADAAGAERELGARFAALCARGGDTRPVARFEVEQAIRYGESEVAAMSDARVAEELGGHEHRDYAAEDAYLERSAHELDRLRALAAPSTARQKPDNQQVTAPFDEGCDIGDRPFHADVTPEDSGDTAGSVLMTATEPEYAALVAQIEGDFWEARPSLATVYAAALAGTASPWATLAVVIMRVLAAVPHDVYLPGIHNPDADGPSHSPTGSLNLYAGIVAPSSGGKGLAAGVAARLYQHPSIYTAGAGSGEGVGQLFGGMVTDKETKQTEFVWARRSVLLDVPEVDMLTAISGRQSSTIDSVLRQAFSGETIAFSYSTMEKRLRLTAHGYRLTGVVSVQPKRAAGLFAGADGGTPQRFIWAPSVDHRIGDPVRYDGRILSRIGERDERGEPFRPEWWPDGGHTIDVCPEALREIWNERLRRARNVDFIEDPDNPDTLDGHTMYAREKVAAALGILDGRDHVTVDDWDLAGVVVAMSFLTRNRLVEAMEIGRLQAAEKRGQERGAEQVGAKVTAQEIDGARIAETEQRVMRIVGQHDGAVPRRDVLSGVSKAQRPYVQTALDSLTENGLLEREEIEPTRKGGRPGVLYKAVRA
ncbi:hypothetical protein FK529_05565 [Tsukamurella asaccharolytica]|uniref:DUF3987 domain-containing protein n=1 Tax=Tsukamurella asaccharolytica TaxID=2592067 RepID=A0A5C5RFA3_9ACTN|nr:hypothetical protein [Tsukamurella asaccharolytica]TWS20791.1 hypothetical protein FK529_05565 [Tsukamurella asaccharolytica]